MLVYTFLFIALVQILIITFHDLIVLNQIVLETKKSPLIPTLNKPILFFNKACFNRAKTLNRFSNSQYNSILNNKYNPRNELISNFYENNLNDNESKIIINLFNEYTLSKDFVLVKLESNPKILNTLQIANIVSSSIGKLEIINKLNKKLEKLDLTKSAFIIDESNTEFSSCISQYGYAKTYLFKFNVDINGAKNSFLIFLLYEESLEISQSEYSRISKLIQEISRQILFSSKLIKISEKLEEALKIDTNKSELIRSFSHDFRTPVNTVKSVIYLLGSKSNILQRKMS